MNGPIYIFPVQNDVGVTNDDPELFLTRRRGWKTEGEALAVGIASYVFSTPARIKCNK